MNYILKIVGVITISLPLIACKGKLLGSATLSLGVGSNIAYDSITTWIRVGNLPKAFNREFFGDETGDLYFLRSGDEGFDELALMLTNGDNDIFQLGMDGPHGVTTQTINEAYYFFEDRTGDSGVDFYGYTISSIELVVDHVSVEQSISGTNVGFSYTLNVYGNDAEESSTLE